MKKEIMRYLTVIISAILCVGILAGCSGTEAAPAAEPEEAAPAEELAEEEYFEEEPYEEEIPEEEVYEEDETEEADDSTENSGGSPVGRWYTDGYDEDANWALSYCIELKEDGSASCSGYRNKDTGSYEETGDGKVLITFDKCEVDEAGEGYKAVDGFTYTIDMTINGDEASIKIDAPDVISNLEDGTLHRDQTGSMEGDEGEGVDIADGEYVTDHEYEGELSEDGKTMTITTALYEYVNSPSPSYEKRTYVINVSDSCKCTVINEDEKVTSFFDSMDLIKGFLEGKSGLPITLTFKDNELVGILFSS